MLSFGHQPVWLVFHTRVCLHIFSFHSFLSFVSIWITACNISVDHNQRYDNSMHPFIDCCWFLSNEFEWIKLDVEHAKTTNRISCDCSALCDWSIFYLEKEKKHTQINLNKLVNIQSLVLFTIEMLLWGMKTISSMSISGLY